MREALVVVLAAGIASCGGSVQVVGSRDGGAQPAAGCGGTPFGAGGGETIGAPCVPDVESAPGFSGFVSDSVSLQSSTDDTSGATVCLIYHFQGRVTCPYGQNADGTPPAGAPPCLTTMAHPVNVEVPPQCVDRPAAKTVIWSCRCANELGATDDGATYCACPCGTECTSAVSSIGAATPPSMDIAGSYCVPSGFTGMAECSTQCDPTTAPCP